VELAEPVVVALSNCGVEIIFLVRSNSRTTILRQPAIGIAISPPSNPARSSPTTSDAKTSSGDMLVLLAWVV